MKSLNFVYGLKLNMMALDHTDNLSTTLQTTNLSYKTARLVVDTITRMQNQQSATSFYEMVKIRADQLSIGESSLPRNIIFRVNFPHGYKEPSSHHNENGNGFYRDQYFAAIDNVTEAIKNRSARLSDVYPHRANSFKRSCRIRC